MKKNVKIMVRLILCIAIAMTMLGCVGSTILGFTILSSDPTESNAKTKFDDLLGTWKTSNTTTTNGKTVTEDHYMKFGFNYIMETSVTKITQGNQPVEMVFFPKDFQSITSYRYVGHMPLSITLNRHGPASRTITFYDETKKNLYVDGNSDKEYTKFDREIPIYNTTLNFGKDTENLKILHQGAIGKDVVINNENIVLDGYIKDLPPNILQDLMYPNTMVERRWTGIAHFNNEEFVIRVDSHAEHEDQYTDYEDFISLSPVQNPSPINSLQSITVHKLPKEYNFKKFDVSFSASFFPFIEEEDMPLKLTSFSVDNKTFSVLLTVKNGTTNPNIYPTDSPFILVQHPKQVFQFVDDSNTVYAELVASGYETISTDEWFGKYEYRDGSYTIFDVDADFDETKLVPAIAVIDIVKNMAQY